MAAASCSPTASRVFSIAAEPGHPSAEALPAALALYYLPDDFAVALVCLGEDQPVFTWFPERVPAPAQRIAAQAIGQVLADRRRREVLGDVLRLHHGLRDEAAQTHAGALIETVYLNHALRFVPDAQLVQCRRLLEGHGLWQVLDEDAASVNVLAAFGLVQSWTRDPALLSHVLRLQDMDLDAAWPALRAAWTRHGLLLVEGGEGRPGRCIV
jgi:hypothetical protein